MKRYAITYMDSEEDVTHVTVEANSVEEAKASTRREYWDIEIIIQTSEQ